MRGQYKQWECLWQLNLKIMKTFKITYTSMRGFGTASYTEYSEFPSIEAAREHYNHLDYRDVEITEIKINKL